MPLIDMNYPARVPNESFNPWHLRNAPNYTSTFVINVIVPVDVLRLIYAYVTSRGPLLVVVGGELSCTNELESISAFIPGLSGVAI